MYPNLFKGANSNVIVTSRARYVSEGVYTNPSRTPISHQSPFVAENMRLWAQIRNPVCNIWVTMKLKKHESQFFGNGGAKWRSNNDFMPLFMVACNFNLDWIEKEAMRKRHVK